MTITPLGDPATSCNRVAAVIKARILHTGIDHPCVPYWTGGQGNAAATHAQSLSRAAEYDLGTIGLIIAAACAVIGAIAGASYLSAYRHRRRSCQRRLKRDRDRKEAGRA